MQRFILLVLVTAAMGLAGCLFTPDSDPPIARGDYADSLTHPDSLMKNFITSYQRREIDPYADLLSRRFIFTFQDGPDAEQFPDGLTFTQDSLFTRNMFMASSVVEIRLSMTWGDVQDRILNGEEAEFIALQDLQLDVEQTGNNILRVNGDTQHYYFQRGREEDNEDPERYYMVAWRDIGSAGKPGRTVHRTYEDERTGKQVTEMSFGRLLQTLGMTDPRQLFSSAPVKVN